MRPRERSLIDPHAGHGRIARQEFGIKGPREADDDIRVAIEQFGQVPAKAIPRVDGQVSDPALYDALAVLERQGQLVNETSLGPDPLPGVYYGNAGIKLSGEAPLSITGSGTSVLGTGFSIALNDANDNSGRITLVTGTGVLAAGLIGTILFARPKQNGNYGVWLTAADDTAATAAGLSVYADFGDRTTTQWKLWCKTALANSVSYHWDYLLVERTSL